MDDDANDDLIATALLPSMDDINLLATEASQFDYDDDGEDGGDGDEGDDNGNDSDDVGLDDNFLFGDPNQALLSPSLSNTQLDTNDVQDDGWDDDYILEDLSQALLSPSQPK